MIQPQPRWLWPAIGAAAAVMCLLLVANMWMLQNTDHELEEAGRQRAEAFCETEFDTRQVVADTLSIIASDPDDEPSDNAAERELADRVVMRLRDMPAGCGRYVDVGEIRIDVGPVEDQEN